MCFHPRMLSFICGMTFHCLIMCVTHKGYSSCTFIPTLFLYFYKSILTSHSTCTVHALIFAQNFLPLYYIVFRTGEAQKLNCKQTIAIMPPSKLPDSSVQSAFETLLSYKMLLINKKLSPFLPQFSTSESAMFTWLGIQLSMHV